MSGTLSQLARTNSEPGSPYSMNSDQGDTLASGLWKSAQFEGFGDEDEDEVEDLDTFLGESDHPFDQNSYYTTSNSHMHMPESDLMNMKFDKGEIEYGLDNYLFDPHHS